MNGIPMQDPENRQLEIDAVCNHFRHLIPELTENLAIYSTIIKGWNPSLTVRDIGMHILSGSPPLVTAALRGQWNGLRPELVKCLDIVSLHRDLLDGQTKNMLLDEISNAKM